ncbi:hypothetical protein SAMN05216332_11099 [Nitrosospira briensis]|nr:hypothetical protein SAMN05216332_11099 [Nitrosospira briensis]
MELNDPVQPLHSITDPTMVGEGMAQAFEHHDTDQDRHKIFSLSVFASPYVTKWANKQHLALLVLL